MAKVSAQGQAVMAALEAGRTMRRMGRDWRAGSFVATAAVVTELIRHDLVEEAGDVLRLRRAGHGFTARGGDGANRLLEERTVADTRRRVTVNARESPLGWLKARGLVSERQHAAGERLRADWTTASLAPSVTMRWEARTTAGGGRGPALDPTMAQIAAKRRFDAAVAAAGAGLSDVLWRVVCAGEGLELAEKALGWPKRAGKLVLLMALDRLADHYTI